MSTLGLLLATILTSPVAASHQAPHGGALVELGGHRAHLELVLDPETGVLRATMLDHEARQPRRLAQPALDLKIRRVRDPAGAFRTLDAFELQLLPVQNPATGEVAGDSSVFAVQSDRLLGAHDFEGLLRWIEVDEVRYRVVRFDYPRGRESP